MPKIKTHKATAKRFWKTSKGKILRRTSGQDHFNARESGVTTRRKRRDAAASEAYAKTIRRLTPYQ